MSFDDHVEYFFGRWSLIRRFTSLEDDVDPLETINFYIQLFNQPAFLFEKYSREQLEQGFWQMQSAGFEASVGFLVGNASLPLALRLDCIRATYYLYKYLFSADILIHSGNMWWDCILKVLGLNARLDSPQDKAEGAVIRTTIF